MQQIKIMRPKRDLDRQVHVYGGATEKDAGRFGVPSPAKPSSFVLATPAASGQTLIIINRILLYYRDMLGRNLVFRQAPDLTLNKRLCAKLRTNERPRPI